MENNSIDSSRGELAVSQEEHDLALYRNMYYQMNAKPDSKSKIYSRKVQISREDIINLNERVKEKIRMHCYGDDGYIATVTVSTQDRKTINFACWKEFESHTWDEVECVNSVILKWNFNIRMPEYEFPQKHVLMVKLSNGLRPEEMLNLIFSGKIEDFEEIETDAFPVAARVDFIKPLLGDELLNIVGDWVKGLRENEEKKNRCILLMRKYRKRVAQYFHYFSFIMCVCLAVSIFNWQTKLSGVKKISEYPTDQFLSLFNLFIGLCFALFVVYKLFENLATGLYNCLLEYGQIPAFLITIGDKRRQERFESKDKKNARMIVLKSVISVIANIACGIIVSQLTSSG